MGGLLFRVVKSALLQARSNKRRRKASPFRRAPALYSIAALCECQYVHFVEF
jgi:hypothetical protein